MRVAGLGFDHGGSLGEQKDAAELYQGRPEGLTTCMYSFEDGSNSLAESAETFKKQKRNRCAHRPEWSVASKRASNSREREEESARVERQEDSPEDLRASPVRWRHRQSQGRGHEHDGRLARQEQHRRWYRSWRRVRPCAGRRRPLEQGEAGRREWPGNLRERP